MPIALIMSLLPQLPGLISFVEQIHGGTAGKGPEKLALLMQLVMALVPTLEAAFNVSPANRALLEKIIGIAVAVMNASGTMPVAPVSVSAPALPTPAGS